MFMENVSPVLPASMTSTLPLTLAAITDPAEPDPTVGKKIKN